MSSACFTTTCLSGCGRGWIATCLQPLPQPLRHVVYQTVVKTCSCFIPHVLVVVVEVGSLHVFSLFYTTCLSGCGRGWIATCLQPVLYHMSQWLWQRLDRYMSSACFTPHVLVVVVEVGSLHVFSLFYTTCLSGCGRGWIATCLQPVLQPHVLVVAGRGWIATCDPTFRPVLNHMSQRGPTSTTTTKTCGIKQAEDMQRSNLYHNH